MTNRVFRKDQDVINAIIALGFVSNADFADEQLIRVYDLALRLGKKLTKDKKGRLV